MLPPIYNSSNGLSNDRRGSGVNGGFLNDNRKQTVAGPSSPSRSVPNGVLSAASGLDQMAERVHALERENERFREELQHLRHFSSNNQQQHENDKVRSILLASRGRRLTLTFGTSSQSEKLLKIFNGLPIPSTLSSKQTRLTNNANSRRQRCYSQRSRVLGTEWRG
ncbi:hypothetical protein AM587_10003920 [Phytophthora nicotianae]|uniref:Uncharacterized protein n=1 Tax=Phytophthora nicotianae TaxID=4792 RepID=A0A0W8DND9_PHYNI|nr:hypothetical protein AM587_10003920 [Phytophthora nicotianae]